MSKEKDYIKQHYVPKTYLKYFAHNLGSEEHPKYITNVYSKIAGKTFERNIADISYKDFFYNISDEYLSEINQGDLHKHSLENDYFDKYVETNLGRILNEIERRKKIVIEKKLVKFPMSLNDKFLLAEQIIIQILRHPKMREYDLNLWDEISNKVSRLFKEGLALENKNQDFAELSIVEKTDDTVIHAQLSYLNEDLCSKFATDLSNDIWAFLYEPSNCIMTSDNPVVCYQMLSNECPLNLGISQKGSIKFWALAPDLLLVMMDAECNLIEMFKDCSFGYLPKECIDLYHKELLSQSNEVYSFLKFKNNITKNK